MSQKARQILSQSHSFPINPIKPIPSPYGVQDTFLIQFRLIRLQPTASPDLNTMQYCVSVNVHSFLRHVLLDVNQKREQNRQGAACAISANYKLSIDRTDRPELVSVDKSGCKAVGTREKLSLIVGSSFGYKDGFKRIER